MKFGKQLPFTRKWYNQTYGEQARTNACSPLLLTNIFNTDFFIQCFTDNKFSEDGISVNQENSILREYFSLLNDRTNNDLIGVPDKIYELYSVFETNAKFKIPSEVLKDLWLEHPAEAEYSQYGEAFVYFMNIIQDNGGFHKVALIQTNDRCIYLDASHDQAFEYEHHEFLNLFPYNKLVNLSVLQNPYTLEFKKYTLQEVSHLIKQE